ncbi:MAG TPA: prepilin-type N-terminal cleavage/methylation domain-containing protein [Bacilli bacterium]|nr:prepilin-type N-terminal cleavage/methylation domain-containing protein [Bacilli bacterium]
MPVWSTTKTILGNKKGFTLIELLVVVAILGVLTVIATTSVLSMLDKNKQKVFAEEAANFINAAKMKSAETVVTKSGLCYSISDLADYVEKDLTGYSGSVFVSYNNKFIIWVSKDPYVVTEGMIGNITVTKPTTFEASSITCPLRYHTLTVDVNGGVWSGTSPQELYYLEVITIEEPTKDGYTFTGWTVNGEDSQINGTEFIMGSENVTLTANWTA